MKTRLIDIARQAQVSQASVSLVLQGKPGVGKKTAQKIQRIANELGYEIPQKHMETPSREITFVKVVKHGNILNADHFLFIYDYIDGIIAQANRSKYGVIIDSYDLREITLPQIVQKLQSYSGSGIVVLATELNSEDLKVFERLTVPFVVLDAYYDFLPYSFFDMNNADSLYKVASYFYGLGHRRIGLCCSCYDATNYMGRKNSFKTCLEQFGLAVLPTDCFTINHDTDSAYQQILNLFTIHRGNLPTAIFCVSDALALNVLKACAVLSISVPKELSVIGFDNLDVDGLASPPLTSVDVPKRLIAQNAVAALLEMIESTEPLPQKKVLMSGSIVYRDSVSVPRLL